MLVNYLKTYVRALLQIYIIDPYEDVEVVVASDKDIKIIPVREAFEGIFGQVKVSWV